MQPMTKNIFINSVFCNTLGWRLRNGRIQAEFSPGQLFRMEQGKEIGSLARSLHPDGIFINELSSNAAFARTQDHLKNPEIRVLFEATFLAGNYVAKADILVRDGKSWELIEVKSSVEPKGEFIDDMAYTTMVAQAAGFSPDIISLTLVDRNYRLGMNPEKLFVKANMTDLVFAKVEEFKKIFGLIDSVSSLPVEPKPQLTFNCKQCEEFEKCLGKEIESHIFNIPRISQKTIGELIASGITSIPEIPDNFHLTD